MHQGLLAGPTRQLHGAAQGAGLETHRSRATEASSQCLAGRLLVVAGAEHDVVSPGGDLQRPPAHRRPLTVDEQGIGGQRRVEATGHLLSWPTYSLAVGAHQRRGQQPAIGERRRGQLRRADEARRRGLRIACAPLTHAKPEVHVGQQAMGSLAAGLVGVRDLTTELLLCDRKQRDAACEVCTKEELAAAGKGGGGSSSGDGGSPTGAMDEAPAASGDTPQPCPQTRRWAAIASSEEHDQLLAGSPRCGALSGGGQPLRREGHDGDGQG